MMTPSRSPPVVFGTWASGFGFNIWLYEGTPGGGGAGREALGARNVRGARCGERGSAIESRLFWIRDFGLALLVGEAGGDDEGEEDVGEEERARE